MSTNRTGFGGAQSNLPRWQGGHRPAKPTVLKRIDANAITTTMESLDDILGRWFELRYDSYKDRKDALSESVVPYQFETGSALASTRRHMQSEAQSFVGDWNATTVREFEKTDAAYRDAMRFLCAAEAMITIGLQYRLALYRLSYDFSNTSPITAHLIENGRSLINDRVIPWIESQGERAFTVPTIVNGIQNMLNVFDLAFEFEGTETCARAGHIPASKPLNCAMCVVDAVNNNATLDRVWEMFSEAGERVMPPSHQSAKERFQAYAPHGYTTTMVPGDGMTSGIQAILYSMREMYPRLRLPTVQEFKDILLDPAYQMHVKAYGLSDFLDFPLLHVDHLGAILMYWGRRNGLNMQLGYLPGNHSPQLIPHPNNFPVLVVWIYSNDVNRPSNRSINTFRGIKMNEQPAPPGPGARFMQDVFG